jgi:myo-inositol 2-dehydrogenase / D-chiro-inositol 1-dehydrogenase
MDDRVEVYGTEGVTYADLFMGNSALTYSLRGYGYAAVREDTEPLVTAVDGRAVLEMIYAG